MEVSMRLFNTKKSVLQISLIMAAIATSTFFVVQITVTFSVAYIFTMLAIAIFCWGSLHLLNSPKSYPWFTAFPMRIWQHLTTQFVLSVVFVLRENLFEGAFPAGLFLFLHIAILGYFAISLIIMKPAAEIIETRGAEVKEKVSLMRLMQADIESILQQYPEHEKSLCRVLDALKYSDPMSHSSMSIYEEQIQRNIFSMNELSGNDSANIPNICDTLLKQIADRNTRVKLMK